MVIQYCRYGSSDYKPKTFNKHEIWKDTKNTLSDFPLANKNLTNWLNRVLKLLFELDIKLQVLPIMDNTQTDISWEVWEMENLNGCNGQ